MTEDTGCDPPSSKRHQHPSLLPRITLIWIPLPMAPATSHIPAAMPSHLHQRSVQELAHAPPVRTRHYRHREDLETHLLGKPSVGFLTTKTEVRNTAPDSVYASQTRLLLQLSQNLSCPLRLSLRLQPFSLQDLYSVLGCQLHKHILPVL